MHNSENLKLIESIENQLKKLKENLSESQITSLSTEDEFEALKKMLFSDEWPEAVLPNYIVDSSNEEEKKERGIGIIDQLILSRIYTLKGLNFLDFGCGEGQCVWAATSEKAKISIGYDVKEHAQWKYFKKENTLFTTDFNEVQKNAPYDAILVYDVLDHLENDSIFSVLKKLKTILSDEGKIFLRVHPTCSKHATHLYTQINKAYIHLIFSEDELNQLYPDRPNELRNNSDTYLPIKKYEEIIHTSGLKIIGRKDLISPTETFFESPIIAQRIKKNGHYKEFPKFQLSIEFIDFILGK